MSTPRTPDPRTSEQACPTASEAGTDGYAVADLERLTRWQDLGGTWRVLARTADRVTVSLCRCDAGEEMERMTSADPAVLNYLGDRTASDD